MGESRRQDDIDIDNLYNQYADILYAYALSLEFDKDTCMDAIHDVFYKLCENKGQLKHVNNVKFYLIKSLRNRLLDIYRSQKKYTNLPLEHIEANMPFKTHLTIEDDYIINEEVKENLRIVQDLLNSLTNRQREIIYFRYIEGMSYEEISDIMMLSLPACRKMVYKTISKLKKDNLPLLPLLFLLFSSH